MPGMSSSSFAVASAPGCPHMLMSPAPTRTASEIDAPGKDGAVGETAVCVLDGLSQPPFSVAVSTRTIAAASVVRRCCRTNPINETPSRPVAASRCPGRTRPRGRAGARGRPCGPPRSDHGETAACGALVLRVFGTSRGYDESSPQGTCRSIAAILSMPPAADRCTRSRKVFRRQSVSWTRNSVLTITGSPGVGLRSASENDSRTTLACTFR